MIRMGTVEQEESVERDKGAKETMDAVNNSRGESLGEASSSSEPSGADTGTCNTCEGDDVERKTREGHASAESGSISDRPSSTSPVPISGSTTSSRSSSDLASNSQKKTGKRDRSNLRKGKWTVEEEEYTSRIIHYFTTGLLTLPEGATLRSYLADKLNCDPMRITKKYAGASCLGRKVDHFRDRPQPSLPEIQLAKAELDHLERRFRIRVEEGHSGASLPSPSPSELIRTLSQSVHPLAMANSLNGANALQSWILSLAAQQIPGANQSSAAPAATLVPSLPTTVPTIANPIAAPWAINPAPAPWLLPNPSSTPLSTARPDQPIPAMDPAIATLALAQAAASLAPAFSQLAAANLAQNQPPAASMPVAQPPMQPPILPNPQANSHAKDLKAAFEVHLKSQTQLQAKPPIPTPLGGSSQPSSRGPVSDQHSNTQSEAAAKKPRSPKRTQEDEDAGTMLMGFLSSLRESYEEAVREKLQPSDSSRKATSETGTTTTAPDSESSGDDGGAPKPAQVTDNVESSVEDSDYSNSDKDKKADPSSSEDSDKEASGNYSRGPMRKRLKTKKAVQ